MEEMNNGLALHGGVPVKRTPFMTGKRFDENEVKELVEALNQNTLFYHFGSKVSTFLQDFNTMYSVQYSVAASSGTAAIHVALGAAGITVGDEVITSPITDIGTVIGILYQNAIPVFADLDPHTYNMSASSIEERITERTKAIVVVHLAGNPSEMGDIMVVARKHGIKVIEDCAQSYLARCNGKLVGTFGDYGCFSTNDFKHISTGEGGIVTINSGDQVDYETAHAFADKNYKRIGNNVDRNIYSLAPNYRMTELQGAVGIAQLKKLPFICKRRNEIGEEITRGIQDIPGIQVHEVKSGNWCSYWFYMFRMDEQVLRCSRDGFALALLEEGIPCQAGYIPEVVYMQPMFQKLQAYQGSTFPFSLTEAQYAQGDCPVAEQILRSAVRVPISEFYSDDDVGAIVAAIKKVALYYQ